MTTIVTLILSAVDLVRCVAVRDNAFRLTFDEQPYYSTVFDPTDAAGPDRYTVTPVDPASRTLFPMVVTTVDGDPLSLDLWVDRPMTPYPAQYVVTCAGLVGAITGDPLGIGTATTYGVGPLVLPNDIDQAISLGDIAQPQDLKALLDPLPSTSPLLLGAFPIDSLGDYASDDGITSYRKRIIRRIVTREDGFAHLVGYGVGLIEEVKKLATPQVRARISFQAELQIKQEPETTDCQVTLTLAQSGMWYLRAICQTNLGADPVLINTPFAPAS